MVALVGGYIIDNKKTADKQDKTLKHVEELGIKQEQILEQIQAFEEKHDNMLNDILTLDNKIDSLIEKNRN